MSTTQIRASRQFYADADVPFNSYKITGLANGTNNTDAINKSQLDTAIAGVVSGTALKGGIDCSTNPNYPAGTVGDVYRVTVAGKIGGASGLNVEVGDRIECYVTSVTGTQAAVGANWLVTQANIDGAVITTDTTGVSTSIITQSASGARTHVQSLAKITSGGSVNIPTGQTYQVNGVSLTASMIGAEPTVTKGNLDETNSNVLVFNGGAGSVNSLFYHTTIEVKVASSGSGGYLSAADWITFNTKEPAVTKGSLSELTSSVLTIAGGAGAVIGSGATITVKQANTSQSGYLSSTDWNTFNTKISKATLLADLIVREVPTGSKNGSNTTFTLANTPVSGKEEVFVNGILMDAGAGNDYTISGATITMLTAPLSTDKLVVTYWK